MLESMKSFDVRNAKCSVENDRAVIEAQHGPPTFLG